MLGFVEAGLVVLREMLELVVGSVTLRAILRPVLGQGISQITFRFVRERSTAGKIAALGLVKMGSAKLGSYES